MSDEPKPHTSRFGAILVLVAVGGSAIGVAGWHLISSRGPDLDTTGFDMSTNPDPRHSEAPPTFSSPAPSASAPAPVQQNSLGMVKADAGMKVVGPGASTPSQPGTSGAAANPTNPKDSAALTMKEAAIKYEKLVDGYVRRMEKKHPNLKNFGKDWAASPELAALRDQYWKEKDPLKFAYGLSKSKDFGALVKKYARDPGVRDTLMTGIKEAPPGLTAAVGGLFQNDRVVKDLASTVIEAVGLPKSLTGFLTGDTNTKMPDSNQVISELMNSPEAKKLKGKGSVSIGSDQQTIDPSKEAAPNNGFRPLGGR